MRTALGKKARTQTGVQSLLYTGEVIPASRQRSKDSNVRLKNGLTWEEHKLPVASDDFLRARNAVKQGYARGEAASLSPSAFAIRAASREGVRLPEDSSVSTLVFAQALYQKIQINHDGIWRTLDSIY